MHVQSLRMRCERDNNSSGWRKQTSTDYAVSHLNHLNDDERKQVINKMQFEDVEK